MRNSSSIYFFNQFTYSLIYIEHTVPEIGIFHAGMQLLYIILDVSYTEKCSFLEKPNFDWNIFKL